LHPPAISPAHPESAKTDSLPLGSAKTPPFPSHPLALLIPPNPEPAETGSFLRETAPVPPPVAYPLPRSSRRRQDGFLSRRTASS